jgi:ABC-type antimicrobial peptide transport system permease subunit
VGVVQNGAFSGVAKDGSMTGIGKAERPNFVFLSERPDFSVPGGKTVHIRYTGGLERLMSAVRAAVREVDGRVPVFSVRTMDEEFLEFTAPIRIITTLIGIFAATGLLLSTVGLYAAIAFHTARRKREFGIRSALGGTPWQVLRAVLKEGLVLTMTGVAAGLVLTAVIARIAGSLLFGVDPTDKVTYLPGSGGVVGSDLPGCVLHSCSWRVASRSHVGFASGLSTVLVVGRRFRFQPLERGSLPSG